MKQTSLIAAAVGSAAVFGLTGTALAAAKDDTPSPTVSISPSADDDGGLRGDGTVDDDPGARATSGIGSPSRAATSGIGISSAEAVRTALAAVGSGRLSEIEAEVEHGYRVWSVEVLAGDAEHDIDVDRTTGEIRRHRSDSRGDSGHGGHGSDD